jgi:alpha-tubulin suppressor-like RCC1 family protein
MGNDLRNVALAAAEAPVLQIASGGAFNCALLADSTVKCWGRNSTGTLGTCWELNDQNQPGRCWDPGYDVPLIGYGLDHNQMGDHLPVVDFGAFGVRSVSLGNFFGCALGDAGQVKCWGNNAMGQLGLGDVNHRGDQMGEMGDSLPLVPLATGRKVEQLVTGNAHACAAFDDNTIRCWGYNQFGQLGLGDIVNHGTAAGQVSGLPAIDP